MRFRSLANVLGVVALLPMAAAVADDAPPGETRDGLLLLESGPKHLRYHVALGGRALKVVHKEYVDRLMTSLDTNKDGKLSPDEAAASPLRPASPKRRGNKFLATLDSSRPITRADIERDLDRVLSDTVIYRQDESAARNDDEIFKVLDEDESGAIDPEEMRTAFLRILERDSDRDQCVTFDEFLPAPPQNPFPVQVVGREDDQNIPRPALAGLLRDMRQTTLPRALLLQYDRDRNQYLTAGELGWDESRIQIPDTNGDGRLTQPELTEQALRRLPVDLELAIEMSGAAGLPALRILSADGAAPESAPRPDLMRIKLGDVTLSLSFRNVDPVERAVATALQQFNQMDMDANGYLERTEVVDRFRFQRGLFDDMDRDGDGKIFGEEMRKYVAARAEPAASSCQVNVYNTGNGFFQILDSSGDGRVSVRELRRLEQTLLEAGRRNGGSLAPAQTGRHYHVEFVRAGYQLFGPTDGMVVQRPEFIQRPPVGPPWFQAMDRNGDGDVTWSEFLGPRRVFDELDGDHDGLIDHQEAERASSL